MLTDVQGSLTKDMNKKTSITKQIHSSLPWLNFPPETNTEEAAIKENKPRLQLCTWSSKQRKLKVWKNTDLTCQQWGKIKKWSGTQNGSLVKTKTKKENRKHKQAKQQTHVTERSEQETHSEQCRRRQRRRRRYRKGVGADERRNTMRQNEAEIKDWKQHVGASEEEEGEKTDLTNG